MDVRGVTTARGVDDRERRRICAVGLSGQSPDGACPRPPDSLRDLRTSGRWRQRASSSGFVGVPVQDAPNLREVYADNILVLRPSELPEEPVDDFWEYDGQRWPVDPLWQDALYGASGLEAAELRHVLEVMDEIAAPIEDQEWMSPGWPLTLALLKVAPQRVQERDRLWRTGSGYNPGRAYATLSCWRSCKRRGPGNRVRPARQATNQPWHRR